MAKWIRRLLADRRGATIVEYGLIMGLMAILILTNFANLADHVSNRLSSIGNDMPLSH